MTDPALSGFEGRLSLMDEGNTDGIAADDIPRPARAGLASENPCPVCGSGSVIPILYGRPNRATDALSEQGLVEMADRDFDRAQPSSRCRDCDHAWSRRTG